MEASDRGPLAGTLQCRRGQSEQRGTGMRASSTTESPWAARLLELMKACGWSPKAAAHKFGLKSSLAIKRLLEGGRPRVEQVLRLRTLEEAYAGEIESFRLGHIQIKRGAKQWWTPGNRFDWRIPETRPQSRTALGEAVGSMDGSESAPRTFKLVLYSNAKRADRRTYRTVAVGQSAVELFGPKPVTP